MNVGSLFVLFGIKTDDKSFKQGLKQLMALKMAASAVSAVIVNVGGGLVHMAMKAAESATHILGTASALGMSTRSIQEWSYVAKQAGSNVEQFTVGVSMFERNLREFAAGRGSRRFKDAMRDVGMSHEEARHALVGPDGINNAIFKVADAYQRMGNTANRASINTGLFGARARGMAQDLGKGSEAIRAQIAHLRSIGGVVDETKLQNLKKFNNAIDDAKTSLNALAMTVVGSLAPKFTKLIDKITVWINENREMISGVLSAAFKVLAFVFGVLFKIVKALGALIHGIMHGDSGAITLLSVLIGLVVTVSVYLTGLIALIVSFATHWDKVKEKVRAFGSEVRSLFNWFIGILSKAGDGFSKLGRVLVDGFWWAINGVKNVVLSVVGFFVEKAIAGVNLVIRALNKLPRVNIGEFKVPEWARHDTADAPQDSGARVAPGAHVPYADTKNARVRYEDTRGAHVRYEDTRGAHVRYEDTQGARVPYADTKNARVQYADIKRDPQRNNVNIAPTTVNIYGVKDADQANKHIADAIDAQHRHAFAALGGE